MVARSIGVLLLVSIGLGGCAASAEEERDEGAAGVVASSLSPPDEQTLPPPFEPRMPALDRNLGGPTWDLQRYFEEDRLSAYERSRCYRYYAKVYDPSRSRDIQIPITVCN